jgi:phosphotriesterase-related protein
MGRSLPRIRAISGRAGVNVVVATGLYFFDTIPGPYASLRPGAGGEDPLTAMFVADIEDGSAATGIRSGIIKCAVDRQGLTPDVERVLRASARAHRRTGVPITTHTAAKSRTGLEQQRVFGEEGVDLSRVIIGHCDDTTDLEYHERLIDNGSYVGMDRLALDADPPLADRLATVATLCERGYADRIVLSHDTAAFNNWGTTAEAMLPDTYLGIARRVLPGLLEHGVTPAQIDAMLIANPRRIFERQGAY